MIKLSRNSYAFDVITRFTTANEPSRNICGLFWQLISVHLIVALVAYVITSPIVGTYSFYAFFAHSPDDLLQFMADQYGWLIAIQSVFGMSMIFAFILVFGGSYCSDRLGKALEQRKWKNINKRTTRRTTMKIVKEYIKTKKNKVCTMVEWTDD